MRKPARSIRGSSSNGAGSAIFLAHAPAALAGWMLPNDAIRLKNVKSDPDYVRIQQDK
jgi:hypothetical protein